MNNDVITSDDVLGKEAVAPNGAILGTVVKLHISNRTKQMVGLTVDMGFMKPDLFVGIEFVKHFGIDAVLLSRLPTDTLKGLSVITAEGKEIGTVKSVELVRTQIKEIVVTSKEGVFSRSHTRISAAHIDKIGGSIILKKGYKLKND
ncbi:MAG: PRC-barrel domain-containing protein [archaeon]